MQEFNNNDSSIDNELVESARLLFLKIEKEQEDLGDDMSSTLYENLKDLYEE